ncbi:MAG TPA: serine/threonine-protein kinase [Kofleriaceae bacterium]|jgi:serine/threonine-protein kinase
MEVGGVIGQYRIVRTLGSGGMGVVYAAEHTLLGRPAAIKVLLPDFSQKPEIVTRFFNEAKAATAIRHPGIIEIYDFGWSGDGSAFIVMELLTGEPLTTRLKAARIPWQRALQLGRQIAGALSAAHDKGIVHRDLKPDNVFIVRDPEVPGGERIKLLDFGIAKLAGDVNSVSNVTRTGSVIGTPTYMSPEGCRGVVIDSRADIYSLGCVLYELMTGRPPFVGEGSGDVLAAHIHIAPPSLAEHGAQVPPNVEALMRMMLAKTPSNRIASANALIDLIDQALGNPRVSTEMTPLAAPAPYIGGNTGPMQTPPTMPTTISGSSVSRTVPPSANKKLLVPIMLGGAALSVVVTYLALSHKTATDAHEVAPVKLAAEKTSDGVPTKTEIPTKTETPAAGETAAPKVDVPNVDPPEIDPPTIETPTIETTVAPESVKLDVDSDPEGAQVFLNGAVLGTTPFHGEVPGASKATSFVVKAAGYQDKRVTFTPDHAVSEKVKLAKVAAVQPKQPTTKPGKNDSVNPFQ